MKQPSLEYLQSKVKAGELSITTQLMDHPSLPNFLSFLKQTEITLKNVSFASENEGEVSVTAKNAFALITLHEVTLTFYGSKVNASDYDFFFQGTITKSSLSELIKSGFISELTQSLLPDLNNIEFNDIVLFFTSFDNSFILEIIDSKSILVIPQINLQLKKIGFSYEKCLTDKTIENFLIHSVLDFGSNKISTNITVPISPESGLKVWSLTLLEAVILNNGLKDVLSFFESYEEFNSIVIKNLVSLLPPDIAVINDFALTELVMHIDAGKKKVQLFNFSIQSLQEFKLLEGFVLKNIGVSVFTTLFDGATNCKLDIFGGFSFVESIFVDINIRLPITGIGDWVIKLEGNADIEKIENLEKLPFIKIKELNLPPELLVLNGISLERLVVILNPKEAKVKSLEFAVQLQAESKLLSGIKVKNPYMEFKFTF